MGRDYGKIFDLVFASADVDASAEVGVDEYVLAEGADAEEEGAESVVGEGEESEEADSEVPASAEVDELEDEDLDVHECGEEGGHEGECEPVSEGEGDE